VLELTGQLIYFGSPLLLAALLHGFCIKYDWISFLKKPIDLGHEFRRNRIFGDHKTWRGLFINVVGCCLGTAIQAILQKGQLIPDQILWVDYIKAWWLVGLLLGFGATLGELPNSFLKRQIGIGPGKKGKGLWAIVFFIFDQIDVVVGIWIFLYLIIRPSAFVVLFSFLLTLFLHLAVSTTGYILGMRKTLS
jgi:hypothetical protein